MERTFSHIFNLENYSTYFYEVWHEWTPQNVVAEISCLKLKSKLYSKRVGDLECLSGMICKCVRNMDKRHFAPLTSPTATSILMILKGQHMFIHHT